MKTLQWAVGFLEGEGTFCLSRKKGTDLAYPRIMAFQNEREPLNWLIQLFGGTICPIQKGWSWSLDGIDVRKILLRLMPFMTRRRKAQIVKVLNGEIRRPEGRGSANRLKKTCPKGHSYTTRKMKTRIKRECLLCKNEVRRFRYKTDRVYRNSIKQNSQKYRDERKKS